MEPIWHQTFIQLNVFTQSSVILCKPACILIISFSMKLTALLTSVFFSHSDDTGIFVSDIIRGSVTDLDGRLVLGDQILSINGEDVRAAALEHAQRLLQVRHIHAHICKFIIQLIFTDLVKIFGHEITYVLPCSQEL